MFSTQLGNFPFATTKLKQDNNSNSSNLASRTMETNNGAGDNQSQIDKTKLIVNYIPQFATEDDLAQIFAPIGRVESIKIMRDYKTGYSFGFGFVKYSTPEDAAKAIEVLNGYTFRNKRLKVSYSRPPGTDMKDSNLYITNLPKDITEQEVDNMFRDYGEIVQRTLLKDKITGMPRGVAFVRYSKGEEAQAAINNLHGKMLENAMLPLSVRVAEDHGRQKAQYLDVWEPLSYNRDDAFLDEDEPDPEEQLIEHIYHHKPLWFKPDNTDPQIIKMWTTISKCFDNKYRVDFLIKKWEHLKERYKKERTALTVFVPGEDPPKPSFYYYQFMKFLDGEPVQFSKKRVKNLLTTQQILNNIPQSQTNTNVQPPISLKNKPPQLPFKNIQPQLPFKNIQPQLPFKNIQPQLPFKNIQPSLSYKLPIQATPAFFPPVSFQPAVPPPIFQSFQPTISSAAKSNMFSIPPPLLNNISSINSASERRALDFQPPIPDDIRQKSRSISPRPRRRSQSRSPLSRRRTHSRSKSPFSHRRSRSRSPRRRFSPNSYRRRSTSNSPAGRQVLSRSPQMWHRSPRRSTSPGFRLRRDRSSTPDGVDGFLLLLGSSLRNLREKARVELQIKILELVKDAH